MQIRRTKWDHRSKSFILSLLYFTSQPDIWVGSCIWVWDPRETSEQERAIWESSTSTLFKVTRTHAQPAQCSCREVKIKLWGPSILEEDWWKRKKKTKTKRIHQFIEREANPQRMECFLYNNRKPLGPEMIQQVGLLIACGKLSSIPGIRNDVPNSQGVIPKCKARSNWTEQGLTPKSKEKKKRNYWRRGRVFCDIFFYGDSLRGAHTPLTLSGLRQL